LLARRRTLRRGPDAAGRARLLVPVLHSARSANPRTTTTLRRRAALRRDRRREGRTPARVRNSRRGSISQRGGQERPPNPAIQDSGFRTYLRTLCTRFTRREIRPIRNGQSKSILSKDLSREIRRIVRAVSLRRETNAPSWRYREKLSL
jgi:hypothetical protein